jgi:two-component system sensor histidine kinase BaeS
MKSLGGLRARLALVLTGVAVASVLIASQAGEMAVDGAVNRFGPSHLQHSAEFSALVAAHFYARDGAWSHRAVAELARLERSQGHLLVIRDATGRALPGSASEDVKERATSRVFVAGRPVGEVSLAYVGGGYLGGSGNHPGFAQYLDGALRSHHLIAIAASALIGLATAVLLSLSLSRPIRRLTHTAQRIEAGDLEATARLGSGAVTELRTLGGTLQRLAGALRKEDASRRAIVAAVAHELRGPVTGLRARTEAAQDGVLTDIPALLSSVHADTLRFARLINDVERLAEAQQPAFLLRKETVDLAALARDRGDVFAPQFAAKGIALTVTAEPAIATGDAERLGQVADNLLENALRYTDRGGHVVLRVFTHGAESIVDVEDTGIGIAPGELPRIFERFWRGQTSHSRAPGSGLGLGIVRDLVQAHGGDVEVASDAGRGSRFRVRLPAADIAQPAATIRDAERPARGARAVPARRSANEHEDRDPRLQPVWRATL